MEQLLQIKFQSVKIKRYSQSISIIPHIFIDCLQWSWYCSWWPEKYRNHIFMHFSSVAQSCPTLCDPMNRSTSLSITNSRSLLKLVPIESVMPSSHLILWVPFSSCPQSLPPSGSFPLSQLFAWGGQSIWVSASASVLPMNTPDWSPLGWTGCISLQSKGLSKIFSNTTV